MKKELTIIVLTYNSQDIIKDCLSRLNFDKYAVVVVDNASRDNTVSIVKEYFQVDRLYQLPTNIGFGNANNIALEAVDTDFALVLNPDAIIDDENIEIMLHTMKQHDKFALAGPVMLDEYPYNNQEFLDKLHVMQNDCEGGKECYYEEISNGYTVRFLVGCTLFFKMKDMRKIGFFDKNIFLFYEDNEICYRVKEKGFHPVLVKEAKAFHLKGTSSTQNLRLVYLRNWHLMWSKLYWKSLKKGALKAKISSIKCVFTNAVSFLMGALTLNKENVAIRASRVSASFCFMCGMGSFKKNGAPRLK